MWDLENCENFFFKEMYVKGQHLLHAKHFNIKIGNSRVQSPNTKNYSYFVISINCSFKHKTEVAYHDKTDQHEHYTQ